MRRLCFFLTLLYLLPVPVRAQRRPLTVPDFIGLDRPGEPTISPDGQWVVYTVTTTDLQANKRRNDLWMVSVNGGDARRISTDSLGGHEARFSPDGRSIAYVSARGGTPQVWIYTVQGGARRQVTTLSTGADGVIWSPDSRMLAFSSSVYPDCRDDACNARRASEDEHKPSKAMMFDGLLYRHWTEWSNGQRSHVFVVDAAGGAPRDLLLGKDYDSPVPPFGGSEQYAFSADSRTLAFTTKLPTHDQAWTTNLDIYTVPVSGGEPTLVTSGMNGAESNPVYSADGRYLAFLSQERAGFESDRQRLMVKDLQSGQVREVTHGWDNSIAEFAFLPGAANDIVAISEKRQRHEGLHIVFSSGDVHEILTTMDPSQLTVATGVQGIQMAIVSDAIDQPAQVYSWVISHEHPQAPRALTHLNADKLAQIAMNPASEFGFVGAGGDSVFGLLVKPPNFDPARRYPLVVLIHGGPQGAWLDQFHGRWNAQLFAAPGYVVAMINPRGSTGFGQRFVDEISGDWGGKPYEDIMRGVDAVSRLPFVDSTRMAAAGGSYGGYMVDWLAGHTDRFKALISHAGVFNLESMYGATEELWFTDWEFGGPYWLNRTDYERFSPHRFAQNMRTPTLVIDGGLDFRVPADQGMQMFTALQHQNVPSRFLYFPDEGHWIGKPANQQVWWNAVQDWLARYLNRPAS